MGFLFPHGLSLAACRRDMQRLLGDRRGNFGMITGLVMVPLIGSAGLAMDFATAMEVRHRLAGAADAAALAAIKNAAESGTSRRASLSSEEAITIFSANASTTFAPATDIVPHATVRRSGNQLMSEVRYSAEVPTTLLRIIGKQSITVSGSASASMELPPYIDFYMLLDNSPSMGLAATYDDMDKFKKVTGCAFACHETDKKRSSYHIAKELGVSTRIDVVRDSVTQLATTAEKARIWNDQYRIGIYTFGAHAEDVRLTAVTTPLANMDTVRQSAAMVDLMTTPRNHYRNNELSIFDDAVGGMNGAIGQGGTGLTSASRQKVLFFISDGVAHQYKKKGTCTGETNESNSETTCIEPLIVDYCDALKKKGVKIAVLYTTYLPLPGDGAWNRFVSKIIDDVPTAMESCASDDLYFEVQKGEDIGRRLHDLFYKVTTVPRLTS